MDQDKADVAMDGNTVTKLSDSQEKKTQLVRDFRAHYPRSGMLGSGFSRMGLECIVPERALA